MSTITTPAMPARIGLRWSGSVRTAVWAGSRTRLVDLLDRGLYWFEVRDAGSQQLLYSRGFCSVFGEWQTTVPAQQAVGHLSRVTAFPLAQTTGERRAQAASSGKWRELWTTTIDPHRGSCSMPTCRRRKGLDRVRKRASGGEGRRARAGRRLHGGGNGEIPCGCPADDGTSVRRRAVPVAASGFQRAGRWTWPPGASGIAQPREGIFRRSALSCQYNTFDLERYVLTFDNRTLRDVASAAPYDNLIILLNN